MRSPTARSAETLVLLALVLQGIAVAILVTAAVAIAAVAVVAPFPYWGWALGIVGTIAAVGVAFVYLAYAYSFEPIRRGEYDAAETPTLVIGIVSLFLGVLPGILYLFAYDRLDSAIQERAPPPIVLNPYAAVAPPPPPSPVACPRCGRVYGVGPFAFCPSCGARIGG